MARYAIDRGDIARALSLLDRTHTGPATPVYALMRDAAATEHPELGRNDRCWCGSGRNTRSATSAIHFVGSIKWLEDRTFDRHDDDTLARFLPAVPGTDHSTPLVAVSRSGVADSLPLAMRWGPADLVQAWRG